MLKKRRDFLAFLFLHLIPFFFLWIPQKPSKTKFNLGDKVIVHFTDVDDNDQEFGGFYEATIVGVVLDGTLADYREYSGIAYGVLERGYSNHLGFVWVEECQIRGRTFF